jgi:ribosome-binding factor A
VNRKSSVFTANQTPRFAVTVPAKNRVPWFMEFQRSDRVADLLLEVLAELLRREIRDPRLQSVNLTGVRVSKDLRHAKVFFSLFGADADKTEALAGLKSAAGFIRSKAGKQLNLRFVPEIEFVYDETEAEAQHIEELLKTVRR